MNVPRFISTRKDTSMSSKLPDGKVCNDCVHIARCMFLISCSPTEKRCDWEPSRFVQKEEECPDCDGSGQVAGAYFQEDGIATCDRCNGKGLI